MGNYCSVIVLSDALLDGGGGVATAPLIGLGESVGFQEEKKRKEASGRKTRERERESVGQAAKRDGKEENGIMILILMQYIYSKSSEWAVKDSLPISRGG